MKRAVLWALILLSASAWAKPKTAKGPQSQKEIDFDGEVVEGMNKRPLDSLTSLSEGDSDRSKGHLYKRTKKFKEENRQLASEIVETY